MLNTHFAFGSFFDYLDIIAWSDADVALSAFECHDDLKGRVGQINFNDDGTVIDALDKVEGCNYSYMWGAMAIQNVYLDEELPNPGIQIMDWVQDGKVVKAIKAKGSYLDVGTVAGLKLLYKTLDAEN